jgi:adenylylsulfate kinase-like enzyme
MARLIWITGLPGSGKTTLAASLTTYLRQRGLTVVHLDGDQLREAIAVRQGYDIETRLNFARSYQAISKVLISQDISVVMSTVSMFKEIYESNRNDFLDYFEVYLDVDFETRSLSGREELYAKAEFAPGVNQHVDLPTDSDLVLSANSKEDRSIWLETLILKLNGRLE